METKMKKSELKRIIKEEIKKLLEGKMVVMLTFKSTDDYYKAGRILHGAGYTRPTQPDAGKGRYTPDDHWRTITISDDIKNQVFKLLNGKVQYKKQIKKPMDYVVYNQGGYLD